MLQKSEHTSMSSILDAWRVCLFYIFTSTLILFIKTYPNPFKVLRVYAMQPQQTNRPCKLSRLSGLFGCNKKQLLQLLEQYFCERACSSNSRFLPQLRGPDAPHFTSCVVMPPQDCSWRLLGLLASLSVCLAECEAYLDSAHSPELNAASIEFSCGDAHLFLLPVQRLS